MAQTRPSPTLSRGFTRLGRFLAPYGMTTGRHRLNRGGHRPANAALYRAIIVRMRYHQPTVDYVARGASVIKCW